MYKSTECFFFFFLNAERRKISEYQWEVNVDSPQRRDIPTLARQSSALPTLSSRP